MSVNGVRKVVVLLGGAKNAVRFDPGDQVAGRP
jgi:hypothetical protein